MAAEKRCILWATDRLSLFGGLTVLMQREENISARVCLCGDEGLASLRDSLAADSMICQADVLPAGAKITELPGWETADMLILPAEVKFALQANALPDREGQARQIVYAGYDLPAHCFSAKNGKTAGLPGELYLPEPQLYSGSLKKDQLTLHALRAFDDCTQPQRNLLRTVLPEVRVPDEPVIYFENPDFHDNRLSSGHAVFKAMARLAGQERVAVCRHPRAWIDRFTPQGYHTLPEGSRESLLLTADLSGKLLVSELEPATLLPLLRGTDCRVLFLRDMVFGEALAVKSDAADKLCRAAENRFNRTEASLWTPANEAGLTRQLNWQRAQWEAQENARQ